MRSNLTGVLRSLPANSDQPISSSCVVNNDDVITTMTSLWRYGFVWRRTG